MNPTQHEPTGLQIDVLGPFSSWQDAWSALPARGEGWVMSPDRVIRFSHGTAPVRFLAAEVAEGPSTSVHVRFDGERWCAWRYREVPGDTHRMSEAVRYEGVNAGGAPRRLSLAYRTYESLVPDPLTGDIAVWTPVVARFVGFAAKEV